MSDTLKPQDVLVVCQLAIGQDRKQTQEDLAKTLHMSSGAVFASLKRCRRAGLALALDDAARGSAVRGPASHGAENRIAPAKILEFLVHGLPTIYYPRKTEVVRGVATATFAPHWRERFTKSGDIPLVWPYGKGKETGEGLVPIYPSIPIACSQDPLLYDVLSTVEILRVGRVREREVAVTYLKSVFGVDSDDDGVEGDDPDKAA